MYNLTILQKNKITTVCIMSQKLIRLTCESNDGVFDGKFDQDIEIKQGSDIAFQSLSLERRSQSFTVNNTNNNVQYSGKPRASGETLLQIATLENRLYEAGDYPILMSDITDKLNKGCNMLTQPQQMNLGWQAVVDEGIDKVAISCRPSPFFPMTVFDPFDAEPLYLDGLDRDAGDLAEIETGAGATGRKVDETGGTQALNESYMYLDKEFTASTGSLRVQIAKCTEGTTDGPAFTIGLVDADGLIKLKNGTIEYADLVYAVQADQVSAQADKGGYKQIIIKGTTAPVAPPGAFIKIENVSGTSASNADVFEIVRKRGLLQGIIHRASGQTSLTESEPLAPSSQVLYPAVFFHLPNITSPLQENSLTACQVSLDPWQDYTVSGDGWNSYVTDNPQINNIRSGLGTVVPYNPDDTSGVALLPFEPQLNFANNSIATFLGFSDKNLTLKVGDDFVSKGAALEFAPALVLRDPVSGGEGPRAQGFSLTAKGTFVNAVDGDSYLVETQTFTLDSYDSYGLSQSERDANSGGSRRNLLAAVLVTEQDIPNSSNSRVTYEPNTLDYIAIKNKSDIITRQLKMRLLDARYGPVSTAGLAAMTILIRDPPKHMDC